MSSPSSLPSECGFFFRDGFGAFLRNGLFSDVTVISPNGKKLKLHKIILANKSKFFERMFSSPDFMEGVMNEVDLRELVATRLVSLDPNNHFPLILEYLYNGKVEVTRDICVSLWHLASFFGCEEVANECSSFYAKDLSLSSVASYIIQGQEFRSPEIITKSQGVIAEHMNECFQWDFSDLSFENFIGIASHPKLTVAAEEFHFHFILKYMKTKSGDPLTPEEKLDLAKTVRLAYLSTDIVRGIIRRWNLIPLEMRLEVLDRQLEQVISHSYGVSDVSKMPDGHMNAARTLHGGISSHEPTWLTPRSTYSPMPWKDAKNAEPLKAKVTKMFICSHGESPASSFTLTMLNKEMSLKDVHVHVNVVRGFVSISHDLEVQRRSASSGVMDPKEEESKRKIAEEEEKVENIFTKMGVRGCDPMGLGVRIIHSDESASSRVMISGDLSSRYLRPGKRENDDDDIVIGPFAISGEDRLECMLGEGVHLTLANVFYKVDVPRCCALSTFRELIGEDE